METDARNTPVRPPRMKMPKKPSTQMSGIFSHGRPPQSVAVQQKICTPLGIVMSRLDAVNMPWPSSGSGVVNMWWTQTPKPMNAVATMESTSGV
jgi:hypothetical protein